MIRVELISTGDEVITGMIDDTNASWLCQELLNMGIQVQRRSTIGDNLDDLTAILTERSQYCDLIFFNGGLGPTTDDCTTDAVCKALGVESVFLDNWYQRMLQWHQAHKRVMPESNKKQAYIPKGATFIDNTCGTACGYMVKINQALCFFTPGVPSEFKEMFKLGIKPYLQEHILNDSKTQVKRLFTFGISESLLQDKIAHYSLPEHIVIGYRSYYPTIELKIIAHGATEAEFTQAVKTITAMAQNYIYSEDSDDIQREIKELIDTRSLAIFDNVSEGIIGMQLNQKISNMTVLATAHQCTESLALSLNFDKHDYALILDKGTHKAGANIYIYNNKKDLQYKFFVNINATIKARKKQAYALIAQIIFLQLLKDGKVSLKPEIATLTEIKE